MKKQQREERLQSANAAWQDMDTDFQFVVIEKVTNVLFLQIKKIYNQYLSSS